MARIISAIGIGRPIEAVFDYATTPAHWPTWHPASLAVSGATDHSLLIGEEVHEDFLFGGRRGSCVWRVIRREPPRLWSFATVARQGRAEITYRLREQGDGTLFERELVYAPAGIWFRILDVLVLRRRMERDSRLALEQLAERLERHNDRGLSITT